MDESEDMGRIHFFAIVPSNTDFDRNSFDDVKSPNPDEMGQFIITQLRKTKNLTIASFGPRTVTSHAYLAGPVSVLESLLHSFTESDKEIRVVLQNQSLRFPRSPDAYYSVKNSDDTNHLFEIISALPQEAQADYLQISLYIYPYTIILLSLPSFIPFSAKGSMKYVANGWNILKHPSPLIHTPCYALIHFDMGLQTESLVLHFLPQENIPIKMTEVDLESPNDKANIAMAFDEEEDIQNQFDEEEDIIYQAGGDLNPEDEYHGDLDQENNDEETVHNKRKKKIKVRRRKKRLVDNNENEEPEEQKRQNEKNKQQTNQKGKKTTKVVNDTIKALFDDDDENLNNNLNNKKRDKKNRDNGDNTEEEVQFEESDYEYEEDAEPTIEEQIHDFVSQLEMTIPSLTDSSIFSTLFQQLFYEKWKSGALTRVRNELASCRDRLKQKMTDEITSLKELVNSDDLTIFIAREEQKLRLLENMTVETKQKVLEQRVNNQRSKTKETPGLFRSYQAICGDNIMLLRSVREKRANIRSTTMDLRIAQMKRIEKLQKYHEKLTQLEQAAANESKLKSVLSHHQQLQDDLRQLSEDREALLKQRDKVRGIIESKKAQFVKKPKK